MKFCDNRIAYLQMIESVVDRMSNISANIKGFAVAVVAGITALSFADVSFTVLALSFSSILILLWLDIYYLGMERKYKYFYEQKRKGGIVDFKLSLDFKESELKKARATKWQCIKSKSIYYFYGPLILLIAVILILKFKGVM